MFGFAHDLIWPCLGVNLFFHTVSAVVLNLGVYLLKGIKIF